MMRFSVLIPLYITLLPTSLCGPMVKGEILALQMPIPSRWIVIKTLARELKEFGYKTTLVIPKDIEKSMTDSGMDVIVSEGVTKFYSIFMSLVEDFAREGFSGNTGFISSVQIFDKFCPYLVEDITLLETLHQRKFAMTIIDTSFVNLCVSVIPYKLSAPYIQIGRSLKLQDMRALIHPGVYPAFWDLPFTDKMSYLQRVQNSLTFLKLMAVPDPLNPSDIVGTFAPEMPHLTNHQLQAKTELYLLDTDELIDYHLPTTPDMKITGGTETRPSKPLTGELKSFIDTATQGVVIISFGTVINIPDNTLNKLSEVFKREKNLKFVIRSGNETKIVGNVMYMSWIPQNDVLGHKNTKIFITHCGDKGQFEALYHGIPMIGMPVFGDQPYNALRITRKGFGINLNAAEFTPNMLRSALQEILSNPSYKDSITKASEIFRNRPMSPRKRAAWWIDHVIKYGGDHLHSEAIHMPLYQFLLLDVLFGFFIAVLSVLFAFIMCFKILRYATCGSKQKED